MHEIRLFSVFKYIFYFEMGMTRPTGVASDAPATTCYLVIHR